MSGIVVLAQDCPATRAVCHAIAARFGDLHVILEDRMPHRILLAKRIRKLGLLSALGQALFAGLGAPVLRRAGALRIQEIQRLYGLGTGRITAPTTLVPSVNSGQARDALKRLDPEVVVVSGTRIIARETLACVTAPLINLHAGITPLYRGVHGGYWALVEGRPDLVGTTIHLVSEGVDSGPVLGRTTFEVTPRDSFATYPYLHTGVGLPVLLEAIERALRETLEPVRDLDVDSRIRYHPTLSGYLLTRARTGVR